jgi:hypothetical protein
VFFGDEKMAIAINPAAPSPEHLAQLDAARLASKKLRRAVAYANFDGWGIAAFAALSIAFSLTSPSGLLLGVGMAYIAWRELSTAPALARLDPLAPRRLAINQLIFSGLLILYFAWCLFQSFTTPSDYSEIIASSPEAAGMVGNIDHLTRLISVCIYVSLIFGTVIFQGGTAWYYSSRAKLLSDYLATTPQWIIEYQRGGGTL